MAVLKKIYKCLLVVAILVNIFSYSPKNAFAVSSYNYSRYHIDSNPVYTEGSNWTFRDTGLGVTGVHGTSPSYTFNSSTGSFYTSNNGSSYFDDNLTVYSAQGSKLLKFIAKPGTKKKITGNEPHFYYDFDAYYKTSSYVTTNTSRGSYIDNIIAPDGTYPDNGVQGSYWYVKGSIANASPVITLNTSEISTTGGKLFSIAGNVYDSDGDNITIKAYLNSSSNPFKTEFKSSSSSFNFPINDLPLGTHTIKITAEDGKGGSSQKVFTAHILNEPKKLNFNTTTSDYISLSFDSNGNPANTTYKIESSTNGSTWSTLITQKSTTYTHQKLQPNTVYYYRISTVYPTNTQSEYLQASRKTLPPKASSPHVTPGESFNNISWNTIPGVTYVLFEENKEIYRGSNNTFKHDSLIPNTSYSYTLSYINSTGEGSRSNPTIGVTLARQPINPLVQALTSKSARIGWETNGNPDGTAYKITLEDGKTSNWITNTSYSFENISTGIHKATILARNSKLVQTSPITFTFSTAPNAPLLENINVDPYSIKGKINKNGNLKETDYKIQTFLGTELIDSIDWTKNLMFEINELSPNTSYKLIAKAKFDGIESKPYEQTVSTYAEKPSDFVFIQKGLDAQFTWKSNNSEKTEYLITLSTGETSDWITDTQFLFTNQPIGAEKTAVLKARNRDGVETDSISISFVINFDPPDNLTAGPIDGETKTNNAVKLEWDKVKGATKYVIYRNKIKIGETQAESFVDATVAPNTDYQYIVHPATTTYESQFGAEVLITTDAQTPIAFSASEVKDTSYILTWQGGRNPKNTQYAIKINGEDQVGWITGTSLKISSATPFTEYKIELYARNRAGVESDPATIKVTTDGVYPVENLKIIAKPESVSLSWNDDKNPSGTTYYDIVREVPGVSSKRFRVVEKNLIDESTRIGRSYQYTVYAVKLGMRSQGVKVGTSVPDYDPPASVTGLSGVSASNQINLTWDQHLTAEKFVVDRVDMKNGKKKTFTIGMGNETSFSDNEVKANSKYEYKIIAIKNNKKSVPSTITLSTLPPIAPNVPDSITAELRDNSIYVDWTDTSQKYLVEILTKNGTKKETATVLYSEYFHSKFEPGETLLFRVYGITNGIKSNGYAEVIFTVADMVLLPAPENVEWDYNPDLSTITLTWDRVPEASSYQVETYVNGKKKTTKTTYITKFELKRVSPKDEYSFKIRARNGKNYDLIISEVPKIEKNLPPINKLLIEENNPLKVALNWKEPTTNKEVQFYLVERWDGNKRNLSKRVDKSTYLDTRQIEPNKEYEYRVYAKYSDGYSSPISKVYKTKPLPQLDTPTAEFRALQKFGRYQYINIEVQQQDGDRIQIVRKSPEGKIVKRKVLYDTNVYRDRVKLGKYIYEITVTKKNHKSGTARYEIDTDEI